MPQFQTAVNRSPKLVKIFAETHPDIKFRNLDSSTFPDMVKPAVCLVQTDSYSDSAILSFQKSLSAQEQEKALRFRFKQDRQSYTITHGILRAILGNFLDSGPGNIEFISNEFGKPSLKHGNREIHFNISHRSGLSALAFSTKSEIGVDVEKIEPELDFELIAKTQFSNDENRYIQSNQIEARKKFYTLWTRKEAFLKAVGIGISENLGIEVFRKVNQNEVEPSLSRIRDTAYYLKSFEFQNNYIISLATSFPGEFGCSLVKIDNKD